MHGERIFARTISATVRADAFGNKWQYHPRSDAHSKVACWAIVFDLLADCSLLQSHVRCGKVGFGINHEMRDFRVNRKKNLDLVICTTNEDDIREKTLLDYADSLKLALTLEEQHLLEQLPVLRSSKVGSTLVALEAKACMTEHAKARPRLYDELSSSYQTILGDTKNAIAAGFVAINVADSFVSPLRNKNKIGRKAAAVTFHDQPNATRRTIEKVRELPRRAGEDSLGFDAVGVSLLRCQNDGSSVDLVKELSDGTSVDDILRYESMVKRISTIYTSRFRAL